MRSFYFHGAALAMLMLWIPVSQSRSDVPDDTRPQFAGVSPRNVELLEDALLRKHPKLLGGSRRAARAMILRRYTKARGPLRGYMAEAIFVDRHPQWGYVRATNAPQNDVYRWVPGRPAPFNGQIKYHVSGRASLYARDMIRDYRAQRFFIPDDHVEPTKELLLRAARRAEARNDLAGAQRFYRDYARVRPIEATSREIRAATRGAAVFAATEGYRGYVSLGTVLGVALLPSLIGREVSRREMAYALAQSMGVAVTEIGTARLLARSKPGRFTRGLGGNVVVASMFTVANTAFIANQYGVQRALRTPEVYVDAGAGLAGWAGSAAAGRAATYFFVGIGPAAPVVVLLSSVGGGYFVYSAFQAMRDEILVWWNPARAHTEIIARMKSFEDRCEAKIKKVAQAPTVSPDAEAACVVAEER